MCDTIPSIIGYLPGIGADYPWALYTAQQLARDHYTGLHLGTVIEAAKLSGRCLCDG
jgi:hypothetical protein